MYLPTYLSDDDDDDDENDDENEDDDCESCITARAMQRDAKQGARQQGKTRTRLEQGKARQGKRPRRGKARQGKARRGEALRSPLAGEAFFPESFLALHHWGRPVSATDAASDLASSCFFFTSFPFSLCVTGVKKLRK